LNSRIKKEIMKKERIGKMMRVRNQMKMKILNHHRMKRLRARKKKRSSLPMVVSTTREAV
jgi:hypothetical protein